MNLMAPSDIRSNVEDFLLRLTDYARLERGKNINDSELIIKELLEGRIKARIKKYTIEVDLQRRLLKHDCNDWRKGRNKKRICKHVVKLFLMIPKEHSKKILRDIVENRDDWGFHDWTIHV